jgi:hypothetical protein
VNDQTKKNPQHNEIKKGVAGAIIKRGRVNRKGVLHDLTVNRVFGEPNEQLRTVMEAIADIYSS